MRAKSKAMLRRKTGAALRARTCSLLKLHTKESTKCPIITLSEMLKGMGKLDKMLIYDVLICA